MPLPGIIYGPDLSYEDHSRVRESLEARSHLACNKLVREFKHGSPLYPLIASKVVPSQASYSLRSGPSCHVLPGGTDRFSNFITVRSYASDINLD